MAITNGQGQIKLGWKNGLTPSLLDSYSGAAAAYSLRKIKNSYTGYAIRVRRSSDNAEQNIGFVSGNLDTASLTTFVGNGNGFVTTWYDQSGSGNNITQSTAANQPQIVSAGSLILDGTKPAIQFNTSTLSATFNSNISGLSNMGIICACKTTYSGGSATPLGIMYFGPDSGWGQVSLSFNNQTIGYRFGTGQSNNNPQYSWSSFGAYFSRGILSVYHQGVNEILRFNGGDRLTFNNRLSTIANTGNGFTIGGNYTSGSMLYHQGTISEMIIYSNDQLSNRQAIESNLNSYYEIFASDSDAQAFISAASITSQTQQLAIDTLVKSLKSAGIWTKMKAIYPFVGGTAASHKWNLKDPRDLDSAYRLVFNGGWVHSSTGAKPNGTTGYANTYLNPYVVFGNNQGILPSDSTHQLVHVSKYSRTNSITTAGKSEGVYSNGGNQAKYMFYGWDSVNNPNGVAFLNGWGYNKTYSSVTLGNRSDGFFVMNRDGYTSLKSFRNNTLISTNNIDIRDYNEIGLQLNLNPNQFFFIGARNDAYDLNMRPFAYNDFETSFQSIGTSLTDAEATSLYNAVQAYQTALGRAV